VNKITLVQLNMQTVFNHRHVRTSSSVI